MAMTDASTAAQRWAQNFGASGQKWADGVNGVTVAPGQLAARSKALWAANTAAAVDRFATNAARVSLQEWQSQTISKGQGRLAGGAQAALPKVEAVFAKLFPFINNVVGSLPPRGDLEQNINRSAAFARGMAKYKTGG
jgi:hypothetical protein